MPKTLYTLVLVHNFFLSQLCAKEALNVTTPLQKADSLYQEREIPQKAFASLEAYQTLAEKFNQSAQVWWRLSMACQYVGLNHLNQGPEKIRVLEKGIQAGRRSIEIDPYCAPCYFWTAINLALHSQEMGIFKSALKLPKVLEYLRKSESLDSTYAFGGASRVQGMIYSVLPSILGGNRLKARDLFKRAIQISPQSSLNYLVLSKLLKDRFNDLEGSLSIALKGIESTNPLDPQIELREARRELLKLSEALKHRLKIEG